MNIGPSSDHDETVGRRRLRLVAVMASAMVLGACASLDPETTFAPVRDKTRSVLDADLQWARDDAQRAAIETRIGELLRAPLTMDAAVQVALLNNRGLQADFDALGISEAERLQSTRLPNPGFAFGKSRRGDEREIERSFHFDLARLIFMPTISRLEDRRHAREQQRVASRVLELASRTRQAGWMPWPPPRRLPTWIRSDVPRTPAPCWRGAWPRLATSTSCSRRANRASTPMPP
ncbi:MAG: hypothetical protein R3E83_06160 [Burkholderiaceae bacterium]